MEKKKLGFKNLELEDQQRLETMKTENEKKHSKFIVDYKELINLLDEEKNPLNLKDILEQIKDKFLSYKNDLMAYYAGLKSILDDTIKRRIFINNRKKNPKNNLKENLDIENIGHKKRLTQVNLSEYTNKIKKQNEIEINELKAKLYNLENSHNSLTNIYSNQEINYLAQNIDISKMIEEKQKLKMVVEKQNIELKNAQNKIAELEKENNEQKLEKIKIENKNTDLDNEKMEMQKEIMVLQKQVESLQNRV